MAEKVIIRSSTIDRHGDYIPLKMMQDYVITVNGDQKMRYLANHRRDIPPIGYFDNAEIQKLNNIYHTLVEPISFKNRIIAPWDDNLVIEDAGEPVFFIKRDDGEMDTFRIAVDKNNFTTELELRETGRQLMELYNKPVALQLNMRKTMLPDPQVVITLAQYSLILYPLLKPFLSKIGEKIAEDIADDVYKTCKSNVKGVVNKLSNTIRLIRPNMVPKDKVLLTIFEIPGDPYIELQIKSDDSIKIEKGLTAKNLLRIHQKIKDFQQLLDISEIYFFLNTKNKWDFSYLLTKEGQVVGTRTAFKKRDKLVTRINLSPTKGFSIGAEGVKFERRSTPNFDSSSENTNE
jgi:hypothetical protein